MTVDRGVTIPEEIEGAPPGIGRPLSVDDHQRGAHQIHDERFFMETPPFASMRAILQPFAAFLPLPRRAGLTVVHARTEFDQEMNDAGRPGSRTRLMTDSLGTALVRGNRLAEIGVSNLDEVLKVRQLDSLIVAGGTLNGCGSSIALIGALPTGFAAIV